MVLDKRTTTIEQLRTALSIPLTPLQYLVSWPINLIDQISQMVSTHDSLVKENLDLKANQLLLKAQMQRLMAIESENSQLKALLRSSTQIQGKTEIAQLLAIDVDPFIHQVTLNKGSRDNVYRGQPVLDANGVMGQIIQTGPVTSRVLLIDDPQSGVPVQNTRNGLRAIAMGLGYAGKLHLMNVPQTVDIQPGDLFVTSGAGQNYPEGYPVGQVKSVTRDPALAFANILLETSAHLNQSRQVLLVWPSKSIARSH
jgi:rod shape-determining protein MreC